MANLEEYLQAILDKIADGTETTLPVPSWNHEKFLAAIYDALGETVPSVESTDKGKFLHANESTGALEWAEGGGGSGGGDVVVSHITVVPGEFLGDDDTYACDMTVEEIQAAQNSGKTVLGIYDEDELLSIWGNVRSIQPLGGGDERLVTGITFEYVNAYDDLLIRKRFGYGRVGSSVVLDVDQEKQYTLTPAT